ncbi:hypothetical protein ACWM9A_02525 [Acetobacter pasteurianus]
MAEEMEKLWTARELARFLQYQESTITRWVSMYPEKLPPRVSGLGRPRWSPETVRRWVNTTAQPQKRRSGRPRQI